jgi:hypothetical protein
MTTDEAVAYALANQPQNHPLPKGLGRVAQATMFCLSEGWPQDLRRPFDRSTVPPTVSSSARSTTYLAQPDPGLRAELDQIASELETVPAAEDEGHTFFDAALMQSAAIEHHEAIARRFTARYEGSGHVTLGVFSPVCTARLLGDAAAILGDDRARPHYERARDDATRMRIRPECALATLGPAEVLITGDATQQAGAQSPPTTRSPNFRR